MEYHITVKRLLVSLLILVSVVFVAIAIIFSPVGYWHFEEGSGTTTADASGTGKTGTLVNGTQWTTGKIGMGLDFDGINDKVTFPNNPAPTQVTFIGWIYPRSLGGSNVGNVFGIRGNSSQANMFLGLYPGNKFRFLTSFDLAGVTKLGSWFSPVDSVTFNQWQQVAVTYDGSNPNNDPIFYINGQQVATTDDGPAPTGVLRTTAAPWTLGNAPGSTQAFNGKIDEFRVYDQVLNASDILSIYNSDIAPPADTTSPNVSITNPLNGANVSGTISINANASDNVGVAGVQFTLDGANLSSEDLTSPYNISWDTTTFSNGQYSISAIARDAAGNTATASVVTIDVNNFADHEAPTPPTNLQGIALSPTSIQLAWNASTDNVGVAGYYIQRNGSQINSTTLTTYLDNSVIENTTYSYEVIAFDSTGNASGGSNNALVTTPPSPQTPSSLPFFDHFDAPTLDTSFWTPITAGSGNMIINDSYSQCNSPTANDACAIYHTNKINKSLNQLWVFAISDDSSTFPQTWISLVNSPTAPTTEDLTSWNSKLRARIGTGLSGSTQGIIFDQWTNTHVQRQWNGATNQWVNPTALANSPIKGDDYYVVAIEIDGVNNRWRMFSWHKRAPSTSYVFDQGLRLYAISDWVNWNNMESTNDLWLVIGDPLTNSMAGRTRVEWVRVDAGQREEAWTNGLSAPGDTYKIRHHWGYQSVNGVVQFLVPEDRTTISIDKSSIGWDSGGVKDVDPFFDTADGKYYVLYDGRNSTGGVQIGWASSTSPNGVMTKFSGNPIIKRVANTNENAVSSPHLMKDLAEPDPNKRYKIFYVGVSSVGSHFRTYLATAPNMTGPWTKQGVVFDVVGQFPGSFDQDGRAGFGAVFDNGQWFVTMNGKNSNLTGAPMRGTYSYGPSLTNLTRSPTILVDVGVTTPRDITNNLNGRIITISSTAGYVKDGYLEIANKNTQEQSQTRIRKVINSTTLELYHGLDGFTSAKLAKIVQVDGANRIGIGDPEFRNGKWYVYSTPFSMHGAYPGYPLATENTGMLSAPSFTGPYTWEHLATPISTRGSWNNERSNENVGFLRIV